MKSRKLKSARFLYGPATKSAARSLAVLTRGRKILARRAFKLHPILKIRFRGCAETVRMREFLGATLTSLPLIEAGQVANTKCACSCPICAVGNL